MAGGIGGFAEGFSGGLGQGMGIISQVRADKRADAYQKMQAEQMTKANARADAAEGRAQDNHDFETKLRPMKLKQAQQVVDKYAQDIELGGVELATKNMMLEWLPQDHALDVKAKEQGLTIAANQDRRADVSLADSLANSTLNRNLARNQDGRAEQSHNIQQAGAVLPVYTEMLARGITPPKAMTEIIQNSPFGISQQMELARASEQFPQILEQAGKGDFSFMKNGEMAESAMSLARPVAMKNARERGFDPTSARVNKMWIGKDKLAWLEVSARDPKSGQYRTFNYGVPMDHLAGQMELSSRSGAALRAHPSYQQFQQALPNYLSVFRGDVRAAAGKDWDAQYTRYSKVLNESSEDNPDYKVARKWLEQNPDRNGYVEKLAAGQYRTQNARGDASPTDFSRVSSVVSRFTGLTDPADVQKRANGALAIMGKLGSKPKKDMPGIAKMVYEQASATGRDLSDPAFSVQMYYSIQADPKLRNELAGVLSGGSGGPRPSAGGVTPNATPLADARKVVKHLFPQAHITDWQRDPNSDLGKKNPDSWHNRTGAAVDIRPIPGMSFDRFIGGLRSAGYSIIEMKDEVANPSKHATGKHWHVVLGLPKKGIDRNSINGTDLRPYGYSRY